MAKSNFSAKFQKISSTIIFAIGVAASSSWIAGAAGQSYICDFGNDGSKSFEVGASFSPDLPTILIRKDNGILTPSTIVKAEDNLGYDVSDLYADRNQVAFLRFDSNKSTYLVDLYFVSPGDFQRKWVGTSECRVGSFVTGKECEKSIRSDTSVCSTERQGAIMAKELGDEMDSSNAVGILESCLKNSISKSCVK
jgi:hypothetical protein